ncbi:ribosome-interacting GTPase [Skeletonema marinoi]|uniref:Ribosome-interacting GTPase n=1 Tax=Skeletonema marinoi TaxID=267567 RepID=A0AAD9DHG4_9STRA|nr:ribosome-interacting GTPase [Skeletonema marinoi]|mmetsp:Transcript_14990/g.25537  ORF Transcript_14990/g.25537 Transcript_14990/m.25537 type:complete len:375 (+) Transcript_14990:117-1241(+)|eukprot:CAMPEP_0113399114 /NCGR_PEP_ID=MMETSP0013_2-20120614/15353_1 /TAXON_ID=2843 ORGANISM="Skeletonema costatum, Strain 1716" /NCGR_SAMPLE_ID=MMETSP0013_2 /ASSEMBLY_ACC=CAM_ASM_000158 /LENGTH=374 /DNA_ID=CAMNT_0000283967 /DNA_START=94 /DNA_END=1218 /DNA_ORIENTATION=- /assembly_acc=CAM_ASM_000158
MSNVQDQIDKIEAEMARTQKNKATNYHLGTLKAKLAKLRSELLNGPGGKSAGSKDAGRGFDVTKSGDTRIGLVGFPSVGKSTLLTTLTGTRSEAAAYEFTTLTCIPGTMKYKGARIQVLDLPGIIEGAAEGKGRGRQVISTARTCNLILVVLDAGKPLTHKKIIEAELFSFGIRINQVPPNIKIVKKEAGGIGYQEMTPQTKGMNAEVCRMVLKEFKISCAEVILREDVTVDQFIDVIEGNRAYIPVLYVFNKIDSITIEELDILDQMPNYVPISSRDEWNLDELMEEIWNKCNMLRIYTKPKGQIPDYDEPVILHSAKNPTVEEFCNRIHKSLMNSFSHAWVWGRSAKHQPQRVGKDHELMDEDVVQIVKKAG